MSTKLEIPEWLGARLTAGAFSEYAKRKGGDEPTPEPNGGAAAIVIQPAAFAVEPAMKMHGRPDRAVNGTEPLSGRSASQGTELCATAPARAVDPPPSPVPATAVRGDVETIELVPIALTQLRITLFPWTR